jgi:two-component system, OmpR family, phosphate regulon sensor histidine kinase PhoR
MSLLLAVCIDFKRSASRIILSRSRYLTIQTLSSSILLMPLRAILLLALWKQSYPTLILNKKRKLGVEKLNVDRLSGSKSFAADVTQKDGADWIAEVSHELRLPIANIRLLIETLLNGALEDPVVAQRMLLRAQTETERLQSLVSDLLSVEQLASTRLEVQAEWTRLEERAQYAIEATNKLAKELGVTIKLKLEPGYRVYANPEQLDQVLLNLLENAIKFTPKGGSVTIATHDQEGSFSVEDSGIGMPAQEIPKIFQRFYRIDRAKTRGSTGLGLSIVKHILDLHGAKINVTSQEGKGSVFLVQFPGP